MQDPDEGVDSHAVPQEGTLLVHPSDGGTFGQQWDPLWEEVIPADPDTDRCELQGAGATKETPQIPRADETI